MTGSILFVWPQWASYNCPDDIIAIIKTGPDLTEEHWAVTFDEVFFFFFLPAILDYQPKMVLLCPNRASRLPQGLIEYIFHYVISEKIK